MKSILVNCDDFGMHESANRAICALLTAERVSSASIMATGAAFSHAVKMLKAINIDSIGVHLNLSSEYVEIPHLPVSEKSTVPSLLQADGTFPANFSCSYQSFDLREVEIELRAQISLVRQQGFRVSHLNAHQDFYDRSRFGEKLFELVRNLADEYRCPFRRARKDGGLLDTEGVWATHKTAEERYAFYRGLLGDKNREDYELVIHPIDRAEDLLKFTVTGTRRYADFVFFSGDEYGQLLETNEISLLSWDDLNEFI